MNLLHETKLLRRAQLHGVRGAVLALLPVGRGLHLLLPLRRPSGPHVAAAATAITNFNLLANRVGLTDQERARSTVMRTCRSLAEEELDASAKQGTAKKEARSMLVLGYTSAR